MNNPLALIIEDEQDVAELISEDAQLLGFETEIIRMGEEALARLAIVVPDLVLLDLNLPHISGRDILHQIRMDERLTKTRPTYQNTHLSQNQSYPTVTSQRNRVVRRLLIGRQEADAMHPRRRVDQGLAPCYFQV